MISTEQKGIAIAIAIAFSPFPVRLRRLCRVQVVFPDFGEPFVNAVGFMRQHDERRFEATAQEMEFLRRLTTTL